MEIGCWSVSFIDCVMLEESLEEPGYRKGQGYAWLRRQLKQECLGDFGK